MPAVTCALAVISPTWTGMDGMVSAALVKSVDVDVDVAGPGPCVEPRDGLLDLKTFL